MTIKWNKINWGDVDNFLASEPKDELERQKFWEGRGLLTWNKIIPEANLPKDGESVLISDGHYWSDGYLNGEEPFIYDAGNDCFCDDRPTHWAKITLPNVQ